ncbi:2OG-Fe dioxygenase family protein [Photobacterium halotolerans]|uniref:2OG-Fe dioxygenase family protein n=1 Tax=Photobacterium halotolerans TaxID=265726 RepID=UPI0004047811|nr:2OG-Fe dioxygenase family protein [Photobacterium halotolerans]
MIIENENHTNIYDGYKEFENSLICRVNAYQKMKIMGFCSLNSEDFSLTDAQKLDLSLIQRHFDSLALDQYDENAGRYRQHSKYVYLPLLNILVPQSSENTSCYKQDIGFNDEVRNEARKFQPVPNDILLNNLIRSLIFHDFKNSPLYQYSSTVPMEVGIHFIRMKAMVESPSISVPNRLHKDGEPCTWIHLINRVGVSGGENIITDNTKTNILCNQIMHNPLDSIGIVDDLVWHQVKPIHVDEHSQVGYRDVILIDFTPMLAMPNSPS